MLFVLDKFLKEYRCVWLPKVASLSSSFPPLEIVEIKFVCKYLSPLQEQLRHYWIFQRCFRPYTSGTFSVAPLLVYIPLRRLTFYRFHSSQSYMNIKIALQYILNKRAPASIIHFRSATMEFDPRRLCLRHWEQRGFSVMSPKYM